MSNLNGIKIYYHFLSKELGASRMTMGECFIFSTLHSYVAQYKGILYGKKGYKHQASIFKWLKFSDWGIRKSMNSLRDKGYINFEKLDTYRYETVILKPQHKTRNFYFIERQDIINNIDRPLELHLFSACEYQFLNQFWCIDYRLLKSIGAWSTPTILKYLDFLGDVRVLMNKKVYYIRAEVLEALKRNHYSVDTGDKEILSGYRGESRVYEVIKETGIKPYVVLQYFYNIGAIEMPN